MTDQLKDHLRGYLQRGRETLLWKLDGLSEYDIRRPMVPTGTNLLGLVKHVAGTEAEYFGLVFDRPFGEPMPWMQSGEPTDEMWATADEPRDWIASFYRRVWAHSDATIAALPLDSPGRVPWWGDDNPVTLGRILVHMVAETDRHCGHTDIVRELIDGAVGLRATHSNLPGVDEQWWTAYRDRLEQVARDASG